MSRSGWWCTSSLRNDAGSRSRSNGIVVFAIGFLLCHSTLLAMPLEDRVPNLFRGLAVSVNPRGGGFQRNPPLPEELGTLSAALGTFRSQAPVPSASGAFRFIWDPELDTFERVRKGPGLADRAPTLGRGTGTVSVSYTHIEFDRLEGDRLDRLRSSGLALTPEDLASLPAADPARFEDDVLESDLDFGLSMDQVFLSGAFGITDTIDVSMALSINHVRMDAAGHLTIRDPDQDGSVVFKDAFQASHGCPDEPRYCARDGFHDSASGTGDLFLRPKWHAMSRQWFDLALAGVLTLPTGNADELLGFHDPTFTPLLIASKDFEYLSPHVNVGYSFRSGKDVSQAQWIAGTDWRASRWVTFAVDLLGYHDDKRDGINDDVLQAAVGFKLHPFATAVIAGNFQFPLNSDGLRADVIYTGQVEYTF
jgi:hypothetical protein